LTIARGARRKKRAARMDDRGGEAGGGAPQGVLNSSVNTSPGRRALPISDGARLTGPIVSGPVRPVGSIIARLGECFPGGRLNGEPPAWQLGELA